MERALFFLCAASGSSQRWRVAEILYTTLRHQRDDVAPVRHRENRHRRDAAPHVPTAVLHEDYRRALARVVAQWLTTAKMLILDPTNIYCDRCPLSYR